MRYLPVVYMIAGYCVANSAFAAQYMTADEAQHLIFPEANNFKSQSLQLTIEQMRYVEKIAGVSARSVSWRVIHAYKGDQLLGYLLLDEVIGKFELISYVVGFHFDLSIKQVEIMSYRESHGFEIRNTNWRKQFVGKIAPAQLSIGDGIANISGATLSCTHVTDGVRRLSAIVQVAFKK